MKTIKELYDEVMADENLQREYVSAAENDRVDEFLKTHGCGAYEEEIEKFFAEMTEKSGELDDDELENVAAGKKCGTVYKDSRPVVTLMNRCEHFICGGCGKNRDEVIKSSRSEEYLPKCHRHGCVCSSCKYCKYKGGLWLCYNDIRINN